MHCAKEPYCAHLARNPHAYLYESSSSGGLVSAGGLAEFQLRCALGLFQSPRVCRSLLVCSLICASSAACSGSLLSIIASNRSTSMSSSSRGLAIAV